MSTTEDQIRPDSLELPGTNSIDVSWALGDL